MLPTSVKLCRFEPSCVWHRYAPFFGARQHCAWNAPRKIRQEPQTSSKGTHAHPRQRTVWREACCRRTMQQAHCFSGPHKKCDSMRELIHRTLAGKEGKPLSPYSTCKYIACVLGWHPVLRPPSGDQAAREGGGEALGAVPRDGVRHAHPSSLSAWRGDACASTATLLFLSVSASLCLCVSLSLRLSVSLSLRRSVALSLSLCVCACVDREACRPLATLRLQPAVCSMCLDSSRYVDLSSQPPPVN